MNKLLIITGPTATGKTDLALRIANLFNADIISADSRQVYEQLNIGTGKDIPENSTKEESDIVWNNKIVPYYKIGKVRLWGYDLVSPHEDFSVASYLDVVTKILSFILSEDKLPIIVGGTGLYIKAVTSGVETAIVPRDLNLRNSLEDKDTEYLFNKLSELDSQKAGSLNPSDKKNPRRLIRAIEIAQWKKKHSITKKNLLTDNINLLKIGLTAEKEVLYRNVEKRIQKRLDQGLLEEIQNLLKHGIDWHYQSMNTLSYKEWQDYFKGDKKYETVLQEWLGNEKKYIKRQLTWFKNDNQIQWFNIEKQDYKTSIEKAIREWYSQIDVRQK